MKVTATELDGVLIIEPRLFRDERGLFLETYSAERYLAHGIPARFVQDNFSRSAGGTLRGLHFQEPAAQGKLVQVTRGTAFDVVVDIRRGSPTFRRWVGVELSGETQNQLWIPPGFAHGFCALSESVDFAYKCTDYFTPTAERAIRWDDPEIGITWPVTDPRLSAKDAAAPRLAEAPHLPRYEAPQRG